MTGIILKTPEELKLIRRAGRVVAACHKALAEKLVPGATTADIDRFVNWYLTEHGAIAAQRGYRGYRYAICASVNEAACHGLPNTRPLQSGDIVTIDIVADVKGWKADCARTYMIGDVSMEARKLVRAAKASLQAGIKQAQVGKDIAEIGKAIELRAERDGYRVITAFVGHGIGKQLHELPQVPHTRSANTGVKLKEGMVITIEPILSAGSKDIYVSQDGWTARTVDHSLTAQFEHTIAITSKGPQLLTSLVKQTEKKKGVK